MTRHNNIDTASQNIHTNMIDIQIEPLSMSQICRFCDDFNDEVWVLKALTLLLSSADLSHLTESHQHEMYQFGLSELFRRCLNNQEKMVENLRDRVVNSPEGYLDDAEKTFSLLKRGAFDLGKPNPQIANILDKLEIVNELFQEGEYPKSIELKDLILSELEKVKPQK